MDSKWRRIAILLSVTAVHALLLIYAFVAREEAAFTAVRDSQSGLQPGEALVLTIAGVSAGKGASSAPKVLNAPEKTLEPAPEPGPAAKVSAAVTEIEAPGTAEPVRSGKTAPDAGKASAPEMQPGTGNKPCSAAHQKRHAAQAAAPEKHSPARKDASKGRAPENKEKSASSKNQESRTERAVSAGSGASGGNNSQAGPAHSSGGVKEASTRGSGSAQGGSIYRMYGVSSSGAIEKCSTMLRYPEKSRRRGSEGRVKARVAAAPDGHVLTAETSESSGDWYLDSALTGFIKKCRFRSGGVYEVEAVFRLK